MLPEIGELVFSIVVGYMGALEFLYVVRHLYHWSFRHNPEMRDLKSEAESLQQLQDQLRSSISGADEKEALGLKAMKDGVLYKDGFRVAADQKEIDELKERVRKQEQTAERQREIETELARQRRIEEETRKQLKEAEDELRRMEEAKQKEKADKRRREEEAEQQRLRDEEEANQRKVLEAERKKEEEQRRLEEEASVKRLRETKQEEEERQRLLDKEETNRKLIEAERLREERQRQQELEEENAQRLIQAEREREAKHRQQELDEENTRKLIQAEREREEEQRQQELEEENARKLIQAEREREEERRQQELEIENTRKLLEAELEREEKERQQELDRLQDLADEEIIRKLLEAERQRERDEEEAAENSRNLLTAEREREENERLREFEEENSRKLLQAERELQEEQRRLDDEQNRQQEEENYRRLLQMEREMEERERLADEERRALLEHTAALERETAEREAEEKQREIEENEENVRNLLEAERKLELKKREMEEEAENLRQLIEAEKEMEERQRRMDIEALQKLKDAQEEVELKVSHDVEAVAREQPIVKTEISRAEHSPTPTQTVKTQYGQTGSDSIKSKTLLFPGVSEESSSAEPVSSMQSSFSTQQSSEAVLPPELNFDEYERQAPDGGEDMPSLQYSDEYLRSLDGIKNKPLVREDGSGRRRAFKKRRSSGSSTSSRESRASREEELKMFTSLEEEEFENIRKGDSEYETIKYASEPNLKVGKPHRRHKRSPAKDGKRDASDAAKGSLQMLDEEDSNPWGEVKREHYKDSEFWKREKNLSIDEELEEADAKQRLQSPSLSAANIPKMSSFEEATKSQHEEAISVLQRQRSKDPESIKQPDEESDTKNVSRVADARLSPAGSNSSQASASASISPALISPEPAERENSQETESIASRTSSPTNSSGAGLRRSPRVDEMKQYKEQWKTEERKARAEAGENPAIEIDYASDDEPIPQPEEEEYLMEGISDFYDFNASINPSRSRSLSRSRSRSVSPSPQNLSHKPATTKSRSPSPDPASYKFIYQRIHPNADAADQPVIDGLSDFYDYNSKLNRESLTGMTTKRSNEVHRTSVDYVMEDLANERPSDSGAIATQIAELQRTPTTPEYERSISAEWRDVQKLKEELLSGNFKRSTYVGESMDFSDQFENLREEAKNFQRSRSRSRSPVFDSEEMTARVLAKKQLQEKILEDISKTAANSEDFAADITKSYVDRNRRASDTVLIQKPEILFQIQDLIQESEEDFDVVGLEAEEYHHFRRFSLNQEIPTEQYPDDYVCISELEVRSLGDLRTIWTADANVESPKVDEPPQAVQHPHEDVVEEAYESGSDDERQTVVEVEDEIDEDIWDYNERPEESHNEQSECEEADREMDRYAGRHADDWRDVDGAVGGVSDEDSFQIDQIYGEAIKNRKPSGILRDYDSILQEIQISDEDRLDVERYMARDPVSNGNSGTLGLWSPRSRSSRASSGESSRSFLENERRDTEHRYLGDATTSAINSTRLRSRYGIVPSTSFTTTYDDEDTEVDINYVPKKEYNWRKNFKLDEDVNEHEKENHMQYLDSRKFSLGGESITLFSRSPVHSEEEADMQRVNEADEDAHEQLEEEMEQEPEELATGKPSKKKKSKRKSRKGSKGSIIANDEEPKTASRRNSIIPEGDLPKKKSRRESKGNDDLATDAPTVDDLETEDSQPRKKSKKRRKLKQEAALPILNIRLPSPEKKAPAPSVAAIRAALIAPPAEAKPPPTSRKSPKIEDLIGPQAKREIKPKRIEMKPNPSTERTAVSPQPETVPVHTANGEPNRLRSKAPEPSHSPVSTVSPTLAAAQTSDTPLQPEQIKNTPSPSSEPDVYDIIKDGGLYPLF